MLNVNLRSVFLFCKYSVPHMPKGSAIVNISSVHAHRNDEERGSVRNFKGRNGSVYARLQRRTRR